MEWRNKVQWKIELHHRVCLEWLDWCHLIASDWRPPMIVMASKWRKLVASPSSVGALMEVVYMKARGLGEEALLSAFLAKVSTKLDLISHATEGNVACRCQGQSAAKGVPVQLAEEVKKRSALRCSIVIVAFCACAHMLAQYQSFVRGNGAGFWGGPLFHRGYSC
jgi:hypothetical protein